MKTLTPTAESQCRSRHNEPVLLLEIDWSDTETGHYAERAVSVEGLDYSGIILEVGRIRCIFGDPSSEYKPVIVKLFPHDELRDKLANASPEGKPARIKLFFEGAAMTDTVELLSGHVEMLMISKPDRIELQLIGFFRKYDRMLPCDILSPTDFPKAHSDDIGSPFPLIFGETPGLPTLRARVGAATNLRGSILSTDTTIEVDDTSGFPSSGALLIEDEQVSYTGINGREFTGCVRGANGTEAEDHLNRREVIEYMTEHIYLVAGHACKAVEDIKVTGVPVDEDACAVDCNDTTLISGKSLTTITFTNRPRAVHYSSSSRFLEMQFDETSAGNEADNPDYCYDTSIEGFATLVAKISGSPDNDTLRIEQTTDVSGYGAKYGEILKAFLMVEHFESETFEDDYLSVHIAGQSFQLAKPGEEDTAGGEGEVDIDHGHTHSVTGEHTHEMTVKKEPVFTNHIIQIGGTTGSWSELDDIAGQNLNKSGFTTTPSTDRSLQCFVASTTSKGSVEKIQFCCRRGESNMAGSFFLRFYLNGTLEKTYSISGTSSPQTWKSGWETIEGLTWDDLDNANTYTLITPASGNPQNIRLFGVWYELEYLEQPDTYEGTGVKASSDVAGYADDNAHVISEEPISSTSVVEGIDISNLVAGDWGWFNNRDIRVDYNVVGADDGVTGYLLHLWFEIEFSPFEEVISNEVTCTVQGIETAGDGTGALIENPADVLKHILVDLLGFDEGTFVDTDAFAATGDCLDAIGGRFGFALLDQTKASRLLGALAEQARSRLVFDSGKFRLVYRADSPGEACRILESSSLVLDSPAIRHRGLGSVFNKVIGYHSRDYSRSGGPADMYSRFASAEGASSQAIYGIRESQRELFAVRNDEYAQHLVDFLVAGNPEPNHRYRWRSFLRDVDLERGDIVELCDLETDLFKVKGEIVEASFFPGNGAARRLDAIGFEAELEPYALFWSAPGGTYVRFVDGSIYFIVRRELAARLTNDGIFYIKGFVIGDQSLPPASGNPIEYDAARDVIAFALSDNARVMEIDDDGNILLPISEETDQGPLTPGGTPDAIESDASKVWFNIGSTRCAEVTSSGLLRVPKHIVENCSWELLYG